jgi:hypothetical protein
MESKSENTSCMCEGREFENLEKVCQKTSCYICKDGNWEIDNQVPVL